MMKILPLAILLFASTGSALNGTVTINILTSGFQDGSGTPANGMSYGFLVDTNSDGFDLGNYHSFDLTTNGQYLSISAGVTDDWFLYGGSLGMGQTPPQTTVLVVDGGIILQELVQETNISENDEFLVLWFPEGVANLGSVYGGADDGGINMKIPTSGGASAAPSSVNTKFPSFEVVPEPSAYSLIAGVLALSWVAQRRRRG